MIDFLRFVLLDQASSILENERDKMLQIIDCSGLAGIKTYFHANTRVAQAFRNLARQHVLQYVESELRWLRERKDTGTITQDDLSYAKNELQSLLASVETFCITDRFKTIETRKKGQ